MKPIGHKLSKTKAVQQVHDRSMPGSHREDCSSSARGSAVRSRVAKHHLVDALGFAAGGALAFALCPTPITVVIAGGLCSKLAHRLFGT